MRPVSIIMVEISLTPRRSSPLPAVRVGATRPLSHQKIPMTSRTPTTAHTKMAACNRGGSAGIGQTRTTAISNP